MKCPIDVSKMDLTKDTDKQSLQRTLDDIYQYLSQTPKSPEPTFKGIPSGRTYAMDVNDSSITSPEVLFRTK